MPTRVISIDYYDVSVQVPNGMPEVRFEQLIGAIARIAPGEARNFDFTTAPVRLEEYYEDNYFCEGNMVRIRMDGLPQKVNIHLGGMQPLGLDDDDGLGEEVAFLYHKPTQTMLLQRNRHGMNLTQLQTYIEAKSGLRAIVHFRQVVTNEVVRRMNHKFRPKKLVIQVAPLRNMELFAECPDDTVRALKDHATLLDSPSLEITFSISHNRNARLNWGNARMLIDSLRGIRAADEDTVNVLKAVGDDEEDEYQAKNIILDFITDRMFDSQECTSKGRIFLYADRQIVLRRSWEKHESDILQTRAALVG